MTTSGYAERLKRVCLDRAAAPDDIAALGADAARWLRYRRMVRRRLSDTIRHAFPRLEAALGEPDTAALEDGFFAEGALVSPRLRDVPGEWLAWLERRAAAVAPRLPRYALELARLEWAELSVGYAVDATEQTGAPLSMDLPVVVLGALRLLSFEYAVHRFDPELPAEPERERTWLAVYRDGETHKVHLLSTTAVAHALLGELSPGSRTLSECVRSAAAREGVSVDLAFLEALGELLADLSLRGVLRGALTPDLPRSR